MFNIIKFLNKYDIEYRTKGKNISDGWVGVNCPNPDCRDKTFHLGFDLKSTMISCWKCGFKPLRNVISMLLSVPYHSPKIDDIINEFSTGRTKRTRTKSINRTNSVILPKECNSLTDRHKQYLIKRKFDPEVIIRDWQVQGTEHLGDYKFSIIIPVYSNFEIVSFQARDVTDLANIKYISYKDVNLKNYLYGFDYIQDKCIVTEGAIDAWKIGRGIGVSTFGITFTNKQVLLLSLSNVKKIGILYDNETKAQRQACKLQSALIAQGKDAIILNLPDGVSDPAELTELQVQQIIKELN